MTREELNKEISDEIEYEELKEKRKKLVKKTIKIILIVFIISTLFIVYTKIISTSGLKVKEERLELKNIPESFNGFKVIQFSDLQYGSTIFEDDMNKIIKKINDRNPDIVVFTGDLIDNEYKIKHEETEKLIKNLSNIKASIGKYAVSGDEDSEDFNTILELSSKGNIANVDLRIGDITDEEIKTLPKDLTLSNFGKDLKDAKREDIVVGIINMAFEVIGMLAAFVTLNSNIKDVILIGNIVALPIVNDIVKKIEKTQNVNFIIPKNTEYAVVYGAIKAAGY